LEGLKVNLIGGQTYSLCHSELKGQESRNQLKIPPEAGMLRSA